MKTFKINLLLVLVSAFTISLSSCLNDKTNDLIDTSAASFDYKTTKDVNVSITTLNNNNEPLAGVYVEIYTQNPLDENGALKANSTDFLLQKGITDALGVLTSKIAPATTVDSLMILVNQIGLPNYHAVKLSTNDVKLVIGGKAASNIKFKVAGSATAIIPTTARTPNNEFLVLGGWNNSGIPNYFVSNDIIKSDFLADINASLPERVQLTTSHPEYLNSEDDGSLVLEKDAEVWVTFVHEGAGFMNTLAYYTHPNGVAPATKADIKDQTIIYPNVSFSGSGGGLNSGNKVQLFYYDPKTSAYTNIFPAGTTVSWLLRSNGWTGSAVGSGYNNLYSDARFNPEKTAANRKHNVVLKDVNRKIFLLGFEDLNRENGSDNDFNDAVFYATVTPYEAVKGTKYQSIDTPKDADNDGATDVNDEYPNDATKAHNNYYPAKGQTGTLAFEDLWPSRGDYDFNDVVIDYNYNQITNAQNKIVAVDATYTLRASGANNHDGFGIQFNTNPGNVVSVTGQHFSNGFINNASNGTEIGQNNAVIIAFDDARFLLKSYNTFMGASYSTPYTDTLKIKFATPIDPLAFGTAPYNPFIIINKEGEKERGKEVHLVGSFPTTLANLSLLGTNDDNSIPADGKYYNSDNYLPWAINIPTKFDYPIETKDITTTYLKFKTWVTSKGANYTDWYTSKAGYRDNTKIFSK